MPEKAICKNSRRDSVAVPGFEPGLPDSESEVLTTTLYSRRNINGHRVILTHFAAYSLWGTHLGCNLW